MGINTHYCFLDAGLAALHLSFSSLLLCSQNIKHKIIDYKAVSEISPQTLVHYSLHSSTHTVHLKEWMKTSEWIQTLSAAFA